MKKKVLGLIEELNPDSELLTDDPDIAADGKYVELLLGNVTGFTAKKIKISCVLASQQADKPIEFLKYPWQVFKQ